MASNSSSFQNLGNGAYRVSGARVSPTTGRYVTRSSSSASKTLKSSSSITSKDQARQK